MKNIDWAQVDSMLIAGCNGIEIAGSIGIHADTLYIRCAEEKKIGWSDYLQAKRAHGDGLLRAAQYQKAYKDKNPTMLIWLGKQRLNQKENLDYAINKDIEKKFDDKMAQVLSLLGAETDSDLNIDDSNINIDTKS
jgi:hypothetical protein